MAIIWHRARLRKDFKSRCSHGPLTFFNGVLKSWTKCPCFTFKEHLPQCRFPSVLHWSWLYPHIKAWVLRPQNVASYFQRCQLSQVNIPTEILDQARICFILLHQGNSKASSFFLKAKTVTFISVRCYPVLPPFRFLPHNFVDLNKEVNSFEESVHLHTHPQAYTHRHTHMCAQTQTHMHT